MYFGISRIFREKTGFPSCPQLELSRHLLLLEATKTNNRATVARCLGADLPPSVLEGGAPRSGRAWSAQRHSETGRGEPTAETTGRHFCGKTSGQPSPRRLLSNISSDIPATNRNQQQLDFVRRKGVFYGQVSQNELRRGAGRCYSSVKRWSFPGKVRLHGARHNVSVSAVTY